MSADKDFSPEAQGPRATLDLNRCFLKDFLKPMGRRPGTGTRGPTVCEILVTKTVMASLEKGDII